MVDEKVLTFGSLPFLSHPIDGTKNRCDLATNIG